MTEISTALGGIVGDDHVFTGDAIAEDYTHDEALGGEPTIPAVLVRPATADEVAQILRYANEHEISVTGHGSGTGLSGSAIPSSDGILVSFERMNAIMEIDEANHVAVVQPGITLDELDKAVAERGLIYPVFPGEYSASLGGNVNTNAGGMRAVKYGVTRHQLLGLEAVLASGEIIRTGGKYVKTSTGYDLTQLIVGSEGTLALVTEATLKLYPRAPHQATVLAPYRALNTVTDAVPQIVASGIGPMILEYIDMLTMAAMTATLGIDLGIPDEVRDQALAYLVVQLEDRNDARLEEDTAELAEQLAELGAIDVYVLPPQAAVDLITARERAFWVAKAADADDIIDVVVPRAQIHQYLERVVAIGQEHESLIAGCGHAGDGNVHMSVFQKDKANLGKVMHALFEAGMDLGGTISGEHGIGTEKKRYFNELENPVKIELMRGIKATFDPNGILNPGIIFD